MRNYRTISVNYENRIGVMILSRMRKVGLIKINWQVPILDEAADEIGAVMTITGNRYALALLGKIFHKEVRVQLFAIRGKKQLEVI